MSRPASYRGLHAPDAAPSGDLGEFLETHDASPSVDWDQLRIAVFLRLSTETISLRLPMALLSELKALANKPDIPYQRKSYQRSRSAGGASSDPLERGVRRCGVKRSGWRREAFPRI